MGIKVPTKKNRGAMVKGGFEKVAEITLITLNVVVEVDDLEGKTGPREGEPQNIIVGKGVDGDYHQTRKNMFANEGDDPRVVGRVVFTEAWDKRRPFWVGHRPVGWRPLGVSIGALWD
jgi:hypothetical protein